VGWDVPGCDLVDGAMAGGALAGASTWSGLATFAFSHWPSDIPAGRDEPKPGEPKPAEPKPAEPKPGESRPEASAPYPLGGTRDFMSDPVSDAKESIRALSPL
jgi:hypothetical protein